MVEFTRCHLCEMATACAASKTCAWGRGLFGAPVVKHPQLPNPASDCATHNGPANESDILLKLADLHKQATTERSHYYVASVVREAVVEIARVREMLNHFGRLAEQDHNHLTAEIDRLRTALATRASDPAP